MPRKPKKFKPTEDLVRIGFLIDGATAARIDAEAERMTKDDQFHRPASRTDALRMLIMLGLEVREKQRK